MEYPCCQRRACNETTLARRCPRGEGLFQFAYHGGFIEICLMQFAKKSDWSSISQKGMKHHSDPAMLGRFGGMLGFHVVRYAFGA